MPTNVIMPQMGESIFEGTLTKWLKKLGDTVQRDEPLFEISTDKVDAEIPAPAAGILTKMLVHEGQTVQINTVVAEIEEEGAAGAQPPKAEAPPPARAETKAAAPREPARVEPKPPPTPVPPAPPQAPPPATAPLRGETVPPRDAEPPARAIVEFPRREEAEVEPLEGGARSSPLVRRLAAEHGVDLSQVQGTGLGGRITKNDILAYIEQKPAGAAPPRPAPPATPPSPQPPPAAPQAQRPAAPAAAGAGIEVVPLSVMRQKIAQHMVESRHTSAHVNTVFEVDMTRIAKLREQVKDEFEKQNGVKLTYMPFICRAAISALKAFPTVNASLEGTNLLMKKFVNLGIAVALEWGLIVPVIKQADEKSFLGVARAIKDLADRARSKKLSPDEVQGGTFTITNPGGYGAMFGLPIINQPQLAIMGVGSIHKAAVVIDDAIAIRSIVHLSLSYDHRVIDGAVADQFMAHVKNTLENWEEPIV